MHPLNYSSGGETVPILTYASTFSFSCFQCSCVDRKSSDLGLGGMRREYLQTDCAINAVTLIITLILQPLLHDLVHFFTLAWYSSFLFGCVCAGRQGRGGVVQ